MSGSPVAILVAVDFSDASAHAVALAGAIADRCGAAALRLIHAESAAAPAYFTHDQVEALERQQQAVRLQAEQYLAAFGRRHTRHPLSAAVDDRPPGDAILHAAATADLVVMGTHGRRGPSRWWLGSVAERVLRESRQPLVIVRDPLPAAVDGVFSRVLVHAAWAPAGDATLDYARRLAGCFHGEVVDGRGQALETALADARPTLMAVAAPLPRAAAWLSAYGEPLVRAAAVPILFVPEEIQGAFS